MKPEDVKVDIDFDSGSNYANCPLCDKEVHRLDEHSIADCILCLRGRQIYNTDADIAQLKGQLETLRYEMDELKRELR